MIYLIQNFLPAGFFCIVGIYIYRYGQQLARNPDSAWKKHVERLSAQGIDYSSIKRTPEWEENLQFQIKLFKYGGLLMGIAFPTFIILVTIFFTILSMRARG